MNITVTHISKSFDKVQALNDVSFTISDKSITGLVGPNGSGKSTLLRLMACRDTPDEGDILYDGRSMLEYPLEILPQVGLMPDSLPENSSWKVGPYLDFFARANNLVGQDRQNTLDAAIALMKLDTFLDRKLNALSKGMKQRVSLARILMAKPKILLLDEPSAGLDPTARIELRECIKAFNAQGITIFISSHILSDLEDICDSVVVLEKGKLRWAGNLKDWHGTESRQTLRISLDFVEITAGLEQKIKELPHFKELRSTGRKSLEVTIESDEAALDEFMAALFQAHLKVRGMKLPDNSLEEMFKQTTQGELQ